MVVGLLGGIVMLFGVHGVDLSHESLTFCYTWPR